LYDGVIIITIPGFKRDKETANFRASHSFEDYVKDTKDAEIKSVPIPGKKLTVRLAPDNLEKGCFYEKNY